MLLYFTQDAPTGDKQAAACIDSVASGLSNISFVALDIETQKGSLVADPLSVIQAAVNQLLSTNGVRQIVMYTDSSYWQQLAGDTTEFSSYPLWMAAHDRFMSYTDPAGNLGCAGSSASAALVPTYHGGLGLPNLMPPAAITAFSIGGNVVTFVANNQFVAGQRVAISGLTTGTFLNGHKVTVLASNLQTTGFAADFTHPDVGYTPDSGSAALVLFGGWTAQSGVQFDIGAAGSNGACLFGGTYDFDVFDPFLFGPDIAISVSASPSALIIPRGTEASTTLAITPVEGFAGVVTLRCTGEPASSACSISPNTVTLDGTNPSSTTISLQVSSNAATGAFTREVNGNGGGVNRNLFLGLTVQ
ncbi:MAG: GH25 family lysozyme [Bryobacteraceae bacterium]